MYKAKTCPECGGEMDEGRLLAPSGIVWKKKKLQHHLETASGSKHIFPATSIGKNIHAQGCRMYNVAVFVYETDEGNKL
jgi:hypothetical protein